MSEYIGDKKDLDIFTKTIRQLEKLLIAKLIGWLICTHQELSKKIGT
jgi:hypothetical protein